MSVLQRTLLLCMFFGVLAIAARCETTNSVASSADPNDATLEKLWSMENGVDHDIKFASKELLKAGATASDINALCQYSVGLHNDACYRGFAMRELLLDGHLVPVQEYSLIALIRRSADRLVDSLRRFRVYVKMLKLAEADLVDLKAMLSRASDSKQSELELEYTVRKAQRDILSAREDRKEAFYEIVKLCGNEARSILTAIADDRDFENEQRQWIIRR